ncbi:MAG TPA: DUF932 domain-containing protein [Phycisphaerales bacterium]|nr:DUF932 domain-containing protein [Phycisphaerales bacterium]
MAHEITDTDHLVLTGKPAWHGLGTVVEDAPTPAEALQLARLHWLVEQWKLDAFEGIKRIPVLTHLLNVRSDNHRPLGVVGSGYKPVQNGELAEFAQALGRDGNVQVESAGSIRGGRRVWFLIRGESIWVSGKDEVKPYLLIANGHDGTLAMTCQPTTIRVVCKNTLHASLAEGDRSALTIRFRHEGEIADKLEEAKRALGQFGLAREQFQRQAQALQAKDMSREELQRFWLDVYTAAVDDVPAHPVNEEERKRVQRCQQVLARWAHNFDQDRQMTGLGANAWTAMNAVTHWFDHQKAVRAPNDAVCADNRAFNNWWGETAVAKAKVLGMALSR